MENLPIEVKNNSIGSQNGSLCDITGRNTTRHFLEKNFQVCTAIADWLVFWHADELQGPMLSFP